MLTKAPDGTVTAVLGELDAALSSGDIERALALFQLDCYWRDLVTFTWNIKTLEGKDQVRAMLKARLADTRPSKWRIADGEAATETGGIVESWIQFETNVARGYGHLRLKEGRIWTLLTTMSELKGHEEKSGFTRPLGAKQQAHAFPLGDRLRKLRRRRPGRQDRQLQFAGPGRGGVDSLEIGNGVLHPREDPGVVQRPVGSRRRGPGPFLRPTVPGRHQPEFRKAEVGHHPGHGADVLRQLGRGQDDDGSAGGGFSHDPFSVAGPTKRKPCAARPAAGRREPGTGGLQ